MGHTDTKPKGPEAMSLDLVFPGFSHVYGIPERATSLSLKATNGGRPGWWFGRGERPGPGRGEVKGGLGRRGCGRRGRCWWGRMRRFGGWQEQRARAAWMGWRRVGV